MIGETIGHYRIESILGQGGMGVVYLAQDLSLPRKVAIKVIAEDLLHDPSARGRLMREAQIAAGLDHPFICRIFEIVEERDQLFLVMELVTGVPLSAWVRAEARPLDEILRVGSEIAEAIAAAHAAGVIHRDIKPANILITQAGHPKIMDFGLAKALADSEGGAKAGATRTMELLTRTGVIMGTYGYLAPEVLRGAPPSFSSDIFSLGCVLYYMTTGEQPFAGDTPVDGISRTLTHVPEPPSVADPRLPPGFDDVVTSAMEKTPEKRPASVEEMRKALDVLRQQSGIYALTGGPAGAPPAAPRPKSGAMPPPAAAVMKTDRLPSVLDRVMPPHPKRRSRVIALALLLSPLFFVLLIMVCAKLGRDGGEVKGNVARDAFDVTTDADVEPGAGGADTAGMGSLIRWAREVEERQKRGEKVSREEILRLIESASKSKDGAAWFPAFIRPFLGSEAGRTTKVVFPPGFPFVDGADSVGGVDTLGVPLPPRTPGHE